MCAVEWSENVRDAMEGALTVAISKVDENTRDIEIRGGNGNADIGL